MRLSKTQLDALHDISALESSDTALTRSGGRVALLLERTWRAFGRYHVTSYGWETYTHQESVRGNLATYRSLAKKGLVTQELEASPENEVYFFTITDEGVDLLNNS